MLTAPSSNIVVQFTQQFPTWEVFNRWREDWLGGVLADPNLGHRAKTVVTVIYLHLNKDTGGSFPSYETIAKEGRN
jgi:Helix-turn-helix domain